MLKKEDNERLVRVGPGTPGGNLFRRYWNPALLSTEVPENDGAPVRVRLLGEDLIAFRDTNGKVGLVDAYCPHRRAPMFFGRNEECGLRCVYHGWKFDVNGDCADMPSEPADTPLKAKVKLKSYPTFEKGGVIWTHMGPPELKPAPPDYEWLRAPPTHCRVSKTYEACNYLQGLEGGLDTAHSSFVHNNDIGNKANLRTKDRAPQIDVERTDYGYYYVSNRNVGPDKSWVRVYHYMMPYQQVRGGITHRDGNREEVPKIDGHLWVPIDDTQTWVFNWMMGYDDSVPITPEFELEWETFTGRGPDDFIPGTYKLKANLSNDYFIDRHVQKTQTFTGIAGLNTQDYALQEGMGPIVDRSKEFLGTSDKAIIAMRRMLLEAVEDVEKGRMPRGADPSTCRDVRAYDGFVPKGEDWRKVFVEELRPKW